MTRTPVTILVGTALRQGRSQALEQAVKHASIQAPQAVIVEGGPGTLVEPPGITLIQLAAGCVCCVGQLPLRVMLARVLRQVRPARVWIEISDGAHLAMLEKQLQGPGFATAIDLQPSEDFGAGT